MPATNNMNPPQGHRRRADHSPPDDIEDPGSDTCNGCTNNKCAKCKDARTLACPFFRRFPLNFPQCINIKLSRTRDIKQHIQRRHTQSFHYCPVCYEKFASASDFNLHLRSRSCEPRETPLASHINHLSGVSEETQQRLKGRSRRNIPLEDQWYDVWDILFEGADRPSNPYLGSPVEESIDMIRNLLVGEGPQLVHDALERNQQETLTHSNVLQFVMELLNGVQGRLEQVRELGSSQSLDNTSVIHENNISIPPPGYPAAFSTNADDLGGFAPDIFQFPTPWQSQMLWSLSENITTSHPWVLPENSTGEPPTDEELYTFGSNPSTQI